METPKNQTSGPFVKVGPCLYRYRCTGTYYARVKHCGREIRKSLGTKDRKYADRQLRQFRDDLTRTDADMSRMPIEELVRRYMATRGARSEKTRKEEGILVEKLKKTWPHGVQQKVREVKHSDVLLWLSVEGKRPGRKGKTLSGATLQKRFQFIRAVMNLAVLDRVIPSNPCAEVRSPKREKIVRLTPSWDQFREIVRNVASQRFNSRAEESALYLEFIGLAGLGNAEINNLCWQDIGWERAQIQTVRVKTKTAFEVPLYPQLRPLLERIRDIRIEEGLFHPETRIFKIRDAKHSLQNACRRLGFPVFSHRALRRCFISLAIERGIDFKTIAAWQGHSDGGVLIARTYSHLRNEHSDRMAALMT